MTTFCDLIPSIGHAIHTLVAMLRGQHRPVYASWKDNTQPGKHKADEGLQVCCTEDSFKIQPAKLHASCCGDAKTLLHEKYYR